MRPSLTKAEKEILVFIARYWEHEGLAPTFKDIANGEIDEKQIAKKRSSLQSVNYLIKKLHKKGYLEKSGENMRSTYYYPAANEETRRAIQ